MGFIILNLWYYLGASKDNWGYLVLLVQRNSEEGKIKFGLQSYVVYFDVFGRKTIAGSWCHGLIRIAADKCFYECSLRQARWCNSSLFVWIGRSKEEGGAGLSSTYFIDVLGIT